MLVLRVDEILKEKKRSVYWLYKNYFPAMGYTNVNNIVKNKTKRVSYNTLDIFSEALEVSVGELFKKLPEP